MSPGQAGLWECKTFLLIFFIEDFAVIVGNDKPILVSNASFFASKPFSFSLLTDSNNPLCWE